MPIIKRAYESYYVRISHVEYIQLSPDSGIDHFLVYTFDDTDPGFDAFLRLGLVTDSVVGFEPIVINGVKWGLYKWNYR